MIISVRDARVWELLRGQVPRRSPATVQGAAQRKRTMLDAANRLGALRAPPSNRLEVLNGNRSGQNSILIIRQWRIYFHWEGSDAHDVEIVDYH